MNPLPLHLYVHWPFCRRICPYCDFNVLRWRHNRDDGMEEALLFDLHQEANWRNNQTNQWELHSIHFGGGTPSMMPPALIYKIINQARKLFHCTETIEIALEANPEDIDFFPQIAQAGVNRLTLGIQSLRPERLTLLGRGHTTDQAYKAIDKANALFSNIAIDLIMATPKQSLDSWSAELSEALSLPIDHISLYSLTIEAGTAFGKRPPEGLPDNEHDRLLMEQNIALTHHHGFQQYEVSNYARGDRYQSVYNSAIWNAQDYIGIGPGAHGRHHQTAQRFALRKHPNIEKWKQALKAPKQSEQPLMGLSEYEALPPDSALLEWVMMALRLNNGLNLHKIPYFLPAYITTQKLRDQLLNDPRFQQAQSNQLLTLNQNILSLSPEARMTLDYWTAEIYDSFTNIAKI